MALSAKKQKASSATESSSSKAANTVVDATRVNVAKGIKRSTMTFNPTIVQTPPTTPSTSNSSNQSLMREDSELQESVEMVRPFLKGIEENSVLIDITGLPDQQLLREALHAFNKDAHLYRGYNDYIGRVPCIRKYMNRDILGTCWMPESTGHRAILTGFKLKDGTFVKGFPSLPADDTIVNIRFDRLPMEPVPVLKSLLKDRLSHFGEVLDYGISFTQGDYVGQGYATLNITPKPDEPAYETLDRIIYFKLDNGANRQVLLNWQNMPDFCRICQKPDHCKADCPDAKRFIQCHNCNAHGHISRNCPRQEISVTPSKKPRKSPTSPVVSEPNPPIGPRQVETKQQETTDTGASKQQLETPQTSQKDTGIEEEMDVDADGTNRANDGLAVTPNAGTSGAQMSAVNKKQQALEVPTESAAPALTDRELVQYIIPDETMKEPLHMDRPAAEDAPTGKKPRKQLEQGTRKTRGSLASKFNTDNKNKDTTVDSVSIQEQGTTDTAQSSTPNQE